MQKTQPRPFSDYSGRFGEQIDAALRAYTEPTEGCPKRLAEALRYSLLGPGKRLRPMLVLMAAEACGGSCDEAMPAAAAVEMVHAYSLVHDDLPAMDDDDLRRGLPTCHKQFGEALAILSGDALLTMAFEVLAGRVKPAEVAARCCAVLAAAAGCDGMVGGQADDIHRRGTDGGAEMLESIHRRKTGALIQAALQLGGLVAGADRQQLAALKQYGRRLGLAFQITDDLLDVRGNEAALGKRVRKDTDQGKLTFPRVYGIDESSRRAQQLVHEACQSLSPFGGRAEGLEALARYVLERNR